jgi:hypothetical protein
MRRKLQALSHQRPTITITVLFSIGFDRLSCIPTATETVHPTATETANAETAKETGSVIGQGICCKSY